MNVKKNTILLVIGAITFISFILAATYAYFQNQGSSNGNIDTNIITGATDLLSFSFGDEINIQAHQGNFGQNMGNLSDSTTGTALLRAGDTTSSLTATYNIYLVIEANDFIYTTDNQTPEILLNVTDPNGNKIENITGLVHYEDGFDITTRTGGFLLIPDYEISATTAQTIQDWNIEVTLVNLDTDQQANTGKTLTGKLYMTQDQMSSYELAQINNVETKTTYDSINATLDITNGSANITKYYYGIEEVTNTRSASTVEYQESDSPNYEFTNLKANTEYTIYSYVVDENNIKSNTYTTNVTTNEYEIPVINSVEHSVTLNSITVTVSATKGSEEIVKYMYSKDNGISYEKSTSNTYTFTNLTDTTEYDIKIKVVDSKNAESTEYYEAITTEVYILPVVASVSSTTTWNSITLTPTGTNGTNTISKYMYSINDGAYQESNVFNNLTENTEYTIKVKAIDSNNRESNPYTLQVRTDTYKLPTISVSTTSNQDSITVTVNATPGDGNIVSYHYSRNDGSSYQTSSSNSYTFSGLTSGTTYYLKVYVTDSNGRTSAVYSTSKATTYVNPSVSNVTASNITTNSVRINVTASGGSNSISRYYYSSNNGSSYVSSTSSSYTFNNLNPGTKYTFRVYVVDTNSKKSNERTVSATTTYNNPTVNSVSTSNITESSITINVNASGGSNSISRYYYSSNNGSTWVNSTSSSYTFNNLSPGTTYNFKVYVVDTAGHSSSQKSTSATTDNPITLADYIKDLYTSQGANGLYYHNSSLANGAGDNSYRYAGANPNNYVCFGSDVATCPEDNLYRIIGVFGDQVKLIKHEYANSDLLGTNGDYSSNTYTDSSSRYYKGTKTTINRYYWNSNNGSNTWSQATLNTINLNQNYLNNIGSMWSSKIATTSWKVGGASFSNVYSSPVKTAYTYEVGNNSTNTPYNAKIGLMYVSDYGYAASPDNWTTNLGSYNNNTNRNNNWMFMGLTEWTISRRSDNSTIAFYVDNTGIVYNYGVDDTTYAVRPSFYLESSVTYVSGSGSKAEPLRIG